MKFQEKINKELALTLYDRYIRGEKQVDLAKEIGVNPRTIVNAFHKYCPNYLSTKEWKNVPKDKLHKVCKKCGKDLPISEFRQGQGKYLTTAWCKTCLSEYERNDPEYQRKKKERQAGYKRAPDYAEKKAKRVQQYHDNSDNYKKRMLSQAKSRAKQQNLPFNLTIDDIVLPEKCPLLEIPLNVGTTHNCENSYSLDKIIPEKGYVKGNIQVISRKANAVKNNLTLEELELFCNNMLKFINNYKNL